MARTSLRERFIRFAMAVALGGSAFQLSGCDPDVRDSPLDGLQQTTKSLTTALITAFFLTLDDDSSGGGNLTTT